jgi:hypothetical protein
MTLVPMKLVRLTREMRPWCAGQDALLPADTADRLLAEGAADNPRDRFGKPFGPAAPAEAAIKPQRRRGDYRTK